MLFFLPVALYFLFTAQWRAVFFILLMALMAAFVLAIVATLQRYTQLLTRLLADETDIRFLSRNTLVFGKFSRALNLLVEKQRRIKRKRERDRDRLHTVLARMSNGAMLLNRRGEVRFLNSAAAEFLQIDPARMQQRSFPQVVWDYRIVDVWQRCLHSGEEENETIDLDGGRSLRIVVTPFLGGYDRGYLVLLHDLSQMRRLEKVRRDFVSNVSHELRTPLASLRALVETLRDGAIDDPPAAQRFFDRIEVEVDKMTQMVEELLELSRIESGQVPLQLHATSVEKLVEPVVERLAAQAERASVHISVSLSPNMPTLLIDNERAQQVVVNLLHNAIKFTPPGGNIEIKAESKAGVDVKDPKERDEAVSEMAVISVRDTGIGIPEKDVTRIFERFYKTDRARSGGGTGLGLAIAKHIVQAHGGKIWVESRENAGSTFFFTLPLYTHS
jgi:two-component system phosphate regulon sensor histidine kinase PhoR